MALVSFSTQKFALILLVEFLMLKNVNFEAASSDIAVMQNCVNAGQLVWKLLEKPPESDNTVLHKLSVFEGEKA
jgi:hypothetical protein